MAVAAAMIAHGREVITLSGGGWTLDGEPVTVPHTWNAIDGADGGENPPKTFTSCRAVSYVRKAATYSRSLPDPTPGKRQFVKCEAVSIKAIVRVNGREVGRHAGAFTAFCFEVTEFLKPSGNILEIVADNTLDEDVHPIVGDFTMYGGVYRDVSYIETDPVCIDCVTDGADGVVIDANPDTGEVVAHVSVLGGTNETQRFMFENPRLWSPESPAMYSVRVTVRQKGSEDSIEVPFGFRKIAFDADGFSLNGVRRKLKGVCRHQDREGKGWAVSRQDEEEDVAMMKRMGADAVRTSHYPQSRYFLDACDRMGLMVWCEASLVNEITLSDGFRSNMLTQAREMVAQRRNHPSIVVWGLFNEIYSGSKRKKGEIEPYLREVRDYFHVADPSRKVVCASNQYGRKELSHVPDFCAFNVYPGWYDIRPWYFRRLDRDGAMMRELLARLRSTNELETVGLGEYGASGSIHRHNDPFNTLPYKERDCSEEYQAAFHYCNYGAIRDDSKVWGSFVWEMFDSGSDLQKEPHRHGINAKGLVEFDHKTPKDAFWFYKANWNPEPMLHLVGSRRESVTNGTTTVLGFCNAGKVTLSVNGRKIGEKLPDDRMAVIWDDVNLQHGQNRIELSAGTLKAGGVVSFTGNPSAVDNMELHAETGKTADLWISNHTDFPGRRILLDLVGKTNMVYDAKGATLMVRDPAIALHLKDCRNVTIRNLVIDWERPVLTEARITGFAKGETRVRIDRDRYPVAVKDGRLFMTGPGRCDPVRTVRFLDGTTFAPVKLTSDTFVQKTQVREEPDGTIAILADYSRKGVGVQVGYVVVMRPPERPYPAIFVEDSSGILLEDVIVRDAFGMGLIAQKSDGIAWRGTGRADDRTAGLIARPGSHVTAHADATHFSNCRGQVAVENCLFEGMMDDAINVHSTCLQITNVLSRSSVRCMFRHHEAIGFTLFRVGDHARLIRSLTNEEGPVLAIKAVRRLADDVVELDFASDVPADFGVGDTLENADYQCAVTFRGNVIRNNRARGALFTTPGKVVCSSNRFETCAGAAVVLAGDAAYWFESGHCRDVEISGNVISNCLSAGYGRHGHSNGIFSIDPCIRDLSAQKDYCHSNIRIFGNTIFTHDVTLLFARSATGLIWSNNVVKVNGDLPSWNRPPFVLERCEPSGSDRPFWANCK